MIDKDDLQNRQERPMRGQPEADAALKHMRAAAPAAVDKSAAELAALKERITRARAVAPPSGDNQFAQGCFRRGRDAALGIIDGDPAS